MTHNEMFKIVVILIFTVQLTAGVLGFLYRSRLKTLMAVKLSRKFKILNKKLTTTGGCENIEPRIYNYKNKTDNFE